MEKTIYILGAGLSKGIGAPLQSEIVPNIISIDINSIEKDYQEIFEEYRNEFISFLNNTLYVDSKSNYQISLEDIYTPIDRCILDNLSFRNIEPNKLLELRQRINALIVILLKSKLKNIPFDNYIQKFACFVNEIKKKHPARDSLSIISLNWDIAIDNALKREISPSEGVIDYCCYITPYKKKENLLPGLLARGKGLYNIKLLKLHGSMNWLQCQRCQRLYVTFFEKIAADEYLKRPKCRLCEKNYQKNSSHDGAPHLVSQLVMPTFLKDLNNVQLKLIWQNAGIELSEAAKVVFMGYSFPLADFELRQLLSRTVRHNAKIEVVLKNELTRKDINSPEYRYRSFFGKRDIKIYYDGVERYINKLTKNT